MIGPHSTVCWFCVAEKANRKEAARRVEATCGLTPAEERAAYYREHPVPAVMTMRVFDTGRLIIFKPAPFPRGTRRRR